MQVHFSTPGPFLMIDRTATMRLRRRDVPQLPSRCLLFSRINARYCRRSTIFDLVNHAAGSQSDAPNPRPSGELYARYRPAVFAFCLEQNCTTLPTLRTLPRRHSFRRCRGISSVDCPSWAGFSGSA